MHTSSLATYRTGILNQLLIRFEVLPVENRDVVKKELEEILLKELDQDITNRFQEEMKLNNAARAELRRLERQLLKPSQIQYYSGMLL